MTDCDQEEKQKALMKGSAFFVFLIHCKDSQSIQINSIFFILTTLTDYLTCSRGYL